ncbi:MAG TPA: hypothetical protein VEB64_00895 [Azospirillaceae bacterium]|nr:hypothetical protein [Azospirillaceae bacterium]
MKRAAAVLLAFLLSSCAIAEIALEPPAEAPAPPPLPSRPAVPNPTVTGPEPMEPGPEPRGIPETTPETAKPAPQTTAEKPPQPPPIRFSRSYRYRPAPPPASRPLVDPPLESLMEAHRRDTRRYELGREVDSTRQQYNQGNLEPLDYNRMLQKQSEMNRLSRP